MVPTVLELSSEGNTVKLDRGFYVVTNPEGEAGRVPVEDVGVLLLSSSGGFVSKPVLARLMEMGGTAVVCGPRFTPVGMMTSYAENGESAVRAKAQISATAPLKKRLWQKIAHAKLERQAATLEAFGDARTAREIRGIADGVKSGDPDNREAWGARVYWPALFGDNFRRSDEDNPLNGLLNYGYAILRACAARAICATGLLPLLGLKHANNRNPFALADDIMEPFRPLVDALARHLEDTGIREVSTPAKRVLSGVLGLDAKTRRGTSPISDALLDMTQSLLDSYRKKKNLLCVPNMTVPGDALIRSLVPPT